MSGATSASPVLVTIPFSHYCEKARWALDRAGVDYVERASAPGLHRLHTRRAGGRSVPVLLVDGRALTDSTDIVAWAHRRNPGAGLYGRDDAERRAIEALEDELDVHLGPATRRLVYFHLLDDTKACLRLMTRPLSRPTAFLFRAGFPLLRRGMKRMMNIDAAGAERSRAKIAQVFAEVATRLADGRRYLVGDRLTAADITFAALSTPVIAPPELKHLPAENEVPAAVLEIITAMRATPAGELALRLYREDRATNGGG